MWFGPVLPDPGQLLSGLGQELLSNRDGQFEVVRCLLHRPSNNQHVLVDQLTMRVLRPKKEGIFQKMVGFLIIFLQQKLSYFLARDISSRLDPIVMGEQVC